MTAAFLDAASVLTIFTFLRSTPVDSANAGRSADGASPLVTTSVLLSMSLGLLMLLLTL